MSVKRLFNSGAIEVVAPPIAESKDRIVRRAVLVHAGPNGSAVEFASGDGPISFDDARIQAVVDSQNDLIDKLGEHYGGVDKIPAGAYPPLLDQHEADSTNRVIGRLTGRLTFERRSVPKVGDDVACATAEITWLGEDTCARVLDGRIYALSIGIDEATNTLTETSAVIDPAAPGAMILKKGMAKPAAKPTIKSKGATVANQKLAKKLSAAADDLKKLSSKLVVTREKMNLAAAKANVTKRLGAVVKGGRMTPAEFKKIDIARLAALDPKALDCVVDAYEAREPQVLTGQRGTAAALKFSDVGEILEKKQTSQLRREIRGDLKKMGAKLKSQDDDDAIVKKMEDSDKEDMKKKLAEEGDAEHMVPDVDTSDDTAALRQQVEELTTQLGRIAGTVSDLVDAAQEGAVDEQMEPEEPKEMAEDDKKDEAALEEAESKDDDKKELAEGDKSEDDKKEDKEKQSE